jgi:hypothetical protein
MTKDELIRDLCSVEFRTKSKTKELIIAYNKKVREETIREVEEKIIRYQNGFRMGEYGEELAPEYGVIDYLLKQVFPKEEVKPMVEQIPF